MINKTTYTSLRRAVLNSADYSKGARRKKLQAVYDKMLDEIFY